MRTERRRLLLENRLGEAEEFRGRGAADKAMHFISLGELVFREIGTVLSDDASGQRFFHCLDASYIKHYITILPKTVWHLQAQS